MVRPGSLAARFQSLDAYAKTLDDFSVKTLSGGILTIIASVAIALLVGHEFMAYRRVDTLAELVVDGERMEKMHINLDVTFPRAPCMILGLDVMDSSGEQQVSLFQHMAKTRLSKDGSVIGLDESAKPTVPAVPAGKDGKPYCGSCYGGVEPENGCCNSCDDVHQAYKRRGWAFTDPDSIEQCVREGYVKTMQAQAGEGCRMRGFIEVNKVTGNAQILAGESIKHGSEYMHTYYDYMPHDYDFSHTIHRLSFGDEFSAQTNPLDGVTKKAHSMRAQFQYFTKIVGSEIRYLNGTVLRSNQYSATEFVKGDATASDTLKVLMSRRTPGFFIMFDISPMRVIYTEHKRSLPSFLTSVCAIVGGIFTVARLVDGFVFRTERALQRKRESGKLA
ncbi:ER-derived vesicles protein erv46 [Coemansia sp. RSA 2671]|uniref:ER-derived vesicles protein erv46 n=1 Tax=Coemansia linderi TaxID=2663919 RepID=A0ACC1KM30_9FUNG|nr:ER-derived vesicles protein erv46 [Coemansia sp. RSA 2675]KAJ2031711.1 ER-derived vesicles protein erv46 [Coemansia sp. S610]KAJ2348723.1 ER-derived vesicles protein erv46 [Coemansia sp. RSA 2671]KAJ2413946.1 ER-derived vesicles protein erv46 [Coemansia sp. RSA 2530]KAJ2699847.1 ER-derived vesicles protein erv46 [Coemansia sp. IMI 209128]KAJ2791498.1 ER-derived vesicles protein erv46 [Coemansia linderi]